MSKQAVIYLRTSTKNQAKEKTIKTQRFKVEEFAKKNNYDVVKEYIDDGVSGALKNRPGLTQLLKELSKNEVKVLLIYKLDRLARDVHIQEGLIQEFNKYEVRLVSTEEPDLAGKDPFRKAFRQMLGVFSEFEKSMIALRLEGGRERKAREGGWHGGRLYGYSSEEGKLKINPDEANVIKLIFSSRRKKLSYKAIAKLLNEKNIKSARHSSIWRASTIRRMYKNPIYKSGKIKYKGHIYQSPTKPIV